VAHIFAFEVLPQDENSFSIFRVPHVCPGLANVGPGPKPRIHSLRKRCCASDRRRGPGPAS
jgi:hypothetical protein